MANKTGKRVTDLVECLVFQQLCKVGIIGSILPTRKQNQRRWVKESAQRYIVISGEQDLNAKLDI